MTVERSSRITFSYVISLLSSQHVHNTITRLEVLIIHVFRFFIFVENIAGCPHTLATLPVFVRLKHFAFLFSCFLAQDDNVNVA